MTVPDLLSVGQLVGGLAEVGRAIWDEVDYSAEEQAADRNNANATAATREATAANLQAVQAREETTRQLITYSLAGVLGVSAVFLASRLIK